MAMMDTISLEDVARLTRSNALGYNEGPVGAQVSADGKWLLYLKAPTGSLTQSLWRRALTWGDGKLQVGDAEVLLDANGQTLAESNEGAKVAAREFTVEEQLQRERLRQTALGLTSYRQLPAEHGEDAGLLVPCPRGTLRLKSVGADMALTTSVPQRLASTGQEWEGLKLETVSQSCLQKGNLLFASANEVYVQVVPVDGSAPGKPVAVTAPTISSSARSQRGEASFVEQEEMNRMRGFWPSPCGKWVAFEEVDDSNVPEFRIAHHTEAPCAIESMNYPFAGAANPKVRIGITSLAHCLAAGAPQPVVWLDLLATNGSDEVWSEDSYVPQVQWGHHSRSELLVQRQDRTQNRLQVLRFSLEANDFDWGVHTATAPLADRQGPAGTVLWEDKSDVWVNLLGHFIPLPDGRYLWGSERHGFSHMYLHGQDGACLAQLTEGHWPVEETSAEWLQLDEQEVAEKLHFVGWRDSCLERHLFVVDLPSPSATAGQLQSWATDHPPRQLTSEEGTHVVSVRIPPAAARALGQAAVFLDTWTNPSTTLTVELKQLSDGQLLERLHKSDDPRLTSLQLAPPQYSTFTAADGKTLLHSMSYSPPAAFSAPHPTIVSCYGGPHAQRVSKTLRVRERE